MFWAFIWSSKYHHGLSFEILPIDHVFIINLGVGYKKFHFHTFCTGRGGDFLYRLTCDSPPPYRMGPTPSP